MFNGNTRADMLSLMSIEKIKADRPFSNATEYCLGDGRAALDYLAMRGEKDSALNCSDYDLFRLFWSHASDDRKSPIAVAARGAIERLINCSTEGMSIDEVWFNAADALDSKSGDELYSFDLDYLGVAVPPWHNSASLLSVLGKTSVVPVICPFGVSAFELSQDVLHGEYSDFEKQLDGYENVAVFMGGFEYEEPNEYTARMAYDKLSAGRGITDKERRVLSSQLLRRLFLKASDEEKRVMIFLPHSPDVHSMGELARMIDYTDRVIGDNYLSLTVFAPDAVGLCFASSLVKVKYKKITADTGVCGNGCGAPLSEAAEYWGFDALPLKRASLAVSPAFIGR